VIPSMNQTPKSTQGEYDLYHWMNRNLARSGKIFVPWSDGYMAEAVSGLPSILSPENIDFSLPRYYWSPEAPAADEFLRHDIRYVVISSKYFKLLAVNKKTGEYQYRFSPDIVYQPQQLGIKTLPALRETLLFRMLYDPGSLKRFVPRYSVRDEEEDTGYVVFEVLPPSEKPGIMVQ